MAKLTDEQRDFLLGTIHTAKIATIRKDGRPHVAPIWFDLDGDTLVFTTGHTTAKAANIRRDNRVCLCIDDEQPPFAYLQFEGTATFSDDKAALKRWATSIAGRYMGEQLAESYGNRNAVEGELLVRVTPTRIHFEKNISD